MASSRRALFRSPPVVPPKMEHDTLDERHPDDRVQSSDKDAGRSDDIAARGPKLTKDRWRRIALAAYLRAERRGFAADAELEDWLAAEKEVDEQLAAESSKGAIDDGK